MKYGLFAILLIAALPMRAQQHAATSDLEQKMQWFADAKLGIFIHAGINLGLLPVTGTTIPFMSYGGSHLIVEFAALGIVAALAREARSVPREAAGQEYLGG